MSNQKNNSLLTFLSDYVDGKKDFNLAEIEGGIHFYKINNLYNLSVENNSKAILENPVTDSAELSEESVTSEETLTNKSENNDEKVVKTDKKWTQEFANEIGKFCYEKLVEKKSISKAEMILAFDKKFLAKVPDCDKIKNGNAAPKYVSKLHKNIYNKLILNDKAEFNNGIYTLVK